VGIILLAAGLAIAIVGGVLAATKSLNKVNNFQRVTVASGSGTVTFSKAGGYLAYYESGSVRDSTNQTIPEIRGTLTNSAAGETVQLVTPYGNRSDGNIKYLHYDYNGHKGLAMWQFHINQPGTFQVQLQRNPAAASDATVAFGPSIAQGVVVGGILVILGVLLLLAGAITLTVGLVKRRRHKREFRTGGYGAPAPAGGQWPGQQVGWPQAGDQGGSAWPQSQNWSQSQTWPPPDNPPRWPPSST
jgi:hypothetical protein